jgi:hypothetical protein
MLSSSSSSSPESKKVWFGELITIHEFPITLGDNPACSSGAPVQLGWKALESTTRNMELYEYVRKGERKRDRRQLIIPVEKRGRILLKRGYSIDQIAEATMNADEIKEQRRETLRKQGWDRFGMVLESTGKIPRGVMKGVLGTTGDILATTGDIVMATKGILVGGLASTGRQLSKTFGVSSSNNKLGTTLQNADSKPKTLQARSA